jgi:hypothetical protein
MHQQTPTMLTALIGKMNTQQRKSDEVILYQDVCTAEYDGTLCSRELLHGGGVSGRRRFAEDAWTPGMTEPDLAGAVSFITRSLAQVLVERVGG